MKNVFLIAILLAFYSLRAMDERVAFVKSQTPEHYKFIAAGVYNGAHFGIYEPTSESGSEMSYYNLFKVKLGLKDSFQEIKVGKVTRYRDGGTTIIPTEQGQIYIPSPFNKNEQFTFNGQQVSLDFYLYKSK